MKFICNLQIRFFLVILLIYIFLCNCDKNEDKLPYANINYSFYLSDPAFFQLNSIGGTAFLENEGINGVLIYRRGLDEIIAFEANCTYRPADRCGTRLIDNEANAKDSCCSSVFQLFDGYPISGPATLALYEYKVFIDNDRVIIMNN